MRGNSREAAGNGKRLDYLALLSTKFARKPLRQECRDMGARTA
jgi:hypothetical protein